MIAPIAPFISDEIYTNLTGEESVHLADYPTYDKNYVFEIDCVTGKIRSREKMLFFGFLA